MIWTLPRAYRCGLLCGLLLLLLAACGADTMEITRTRSVEVTEVTPKGMSDAARLGFREVAPSPASPGTDGARDLAWDVPTTWTRGPDKPKRLVTYRTGGGEVECYVTVVKNLGRDLLANVNAWRDQMGLPLATAAEAEAFPGVTILGRPAKLVEIEGRYLGMSGESVEEALLLGAVLDLDRQSLYFKMIGPVEKVRAERENFRKFLETLRVR